MASPFSAAVDAAYRAFGVAATWNGAAVTVIRSSQDSADLGQTRAIARDTVIAVRVSEKATVARGDTVVIGADTLTVQAYEQDSERLEWRCAVRKA